MTVKPRNHHHQPQSSRRSSVDLNVRPTTMIVDPILASLVRSIDYHDRDGVAIPDIPIVLHMGGIMILGDLISERQFAEASKALVKAIYSRREDAIENAVVLSDLTLDDLSAYTPQYIHLKDTAFCIPGGKQVPTNTTEFWRGRLDRVDGFFLGDTL